MAGCGLPDRLSFPIFPPCAAPLAAARGRRRWSLNIRVWRGTPAIPCASRAIRGARGAKPAPDAIRGELRAPLSPPRDGLRPVRTLGTFAVGMGPSRSKFSSRSAMPPAWPEGCGASFSCCSSVFLRAQAVRPGPGS